MEAEGVGQEHVLKCWPELFAAVADGSKTFDLRKDDRGFREGDTVLLREYDPKMDQYSGRYVTARVGYVLRDSCAAISDLEGHVVFSLHDVVLREFAT